MARRVQYWRLLVMGLALGLGFAGLGYRLVVLQVLRHDELSVEARHRTHLEVLLEPRRGDIVDAKGNLLATSVLVKTVCADPSLLGNRQWEVAQALAPLLQETPTKLYQQLLPRLIQNSKGRTVTNQFVVLKRKVPVDTWEKIQTTMSRLLWTPEEKKLKKDAQLFYTNLRKHSVYALDDQLRWYPNQSLAAHVLGYATSEEVEIAERLVNQLVGRDGIERAFDTALTGARGWRLTEADRAQREIVSLREQEVEPRDGTTVVLTLDTVIQQQLEKSLADAMREHSPKSISGIVVRPRTGEILAMASLPNFNANELTRVSPDVLRNRVISDIAEPGSTFKIVVVSGALNDGIVSPADTFECEHGQFKFAGHTLHDHKPYGVLTVEGIIAKSSNIGAAKIGIKMGEDRLHGYIRNFGFGERTGLELPGEIGGGRYVPAVSNWTKVSIAQIPMGHGIAVTRLQMVMAMCALANNGWLMHPMLVDRLEDREHRVVEQYAPRRVRQVVSEGTAQQMVKALKMVCTKDGTAPKAALAHYTVAGKTGTAQKAENRGYAHDKFFASFIGFFPADNPEICISVNMDEPDLSKGYYGGETAAPAFKEIAERAASYLDIPREDSPEPAQSEPLTMPPETGTVKTAAVRSQ